MQEIRRTARRLIKPFKRRSDPGERIHLLHVSKAAGNQLKHVARQINRDNKMIKIKAYGHEVGLSDLPPGNRYFFGTRDPVSRFYSGFYSRKREGRPKTTVAWSEYERFSFGKFDHANDLAEALFDDSSLGVEATAAMRSIRHPARNLVDWFKFAGAMFECRPPVWIVRQERFEDDLQTLLGRLGHHGEVTLEALSEKAHRFDYGGVPPLSEKARRNLRSWYVQDYEFLRLCEIWMVANGGTKQPGE